MPSDDSNSTPDNSSRARRSSFSSSTFNSLLGRSNTGNSAVGPYPGPITTAAAQDQRRRMSTTGTSPTQASAFARRVSVSTNSDSIPESAIDDEDGPASTSPASPFARRMSKAAEDVLNGSNALRKNLGSSNTNGRAPFSSQPSTLGKQASMTSRNRTASDTRRSGEGFNWSEQIRSRAESSVSSGGRPSFSNPSPAEKIPPPAAIHEEAKSAPQAPKPPQTLKERIYAKPDDIGERMLKGDYYY